MRNDESLILNLNDKINVIKALYEREKSLKNVLKGQEKKLQQQINVQKGAIEKLQKEVNVLQMAVAFKGEGTDSHQAKLKINKIVREIDKCVALLNH